MCMLRHEVENAKTKVVPSPRVVIISTPRGSNVFEDFFDKKEEASEPLTMDHIEQAMEKVGMPVIRKKLRGLSKKKQPSCDPRRKNYTARQFGNILLSSTTGIINNTTLNDAMPLDESEGVTVLSLIKPLIDEFFLAQGDKWQITGPMKLSAQEINTGKWKSVSALGGEVIHYKDVEIGTRDGVCIIWETGNIIGMSEEMVINTTIKGYGDKIVPASLSGNPANSDTLVDLMLNHCGEADIVTAGEEIKAKIEAVISAKIKEDLERKTEAYGEEFGLWA